MAIQLKFKLQLIKVKQIPLQRRTASATNNNKSMPASLCNILPLLLVILLLTVPSNSYLQFKLSRIPQQSKKLKNPQFECPESVSAISEYDYKEVCYDKDISYSFEIYKDDQIYKISADLTTPISWFKGKNCHIKDGQKKCQLIESTFKAKISQVASNIKKKLKRHGKKSQDQQQNRKKVQIYGSSNVIQGFEQQPTHMSFEIMDSNRLTRLMDILLLGFYVLGEKDELELESTKFINATSLTQKLSYVSDGAISMRFDENSENSFLNQIFAYTKAEEKIATLYLGENNFMAIGELSLKFSEHGYSGISWVGIQQDQNFGKVPTVSDMIVEDTQRQIQKKVTINKPVILTLSASYIGIHSSLVQKLNAKLSRSAKCDFESHGYVQCNYTKKKDKDRDYEKKLTFSFNDSSISLDLKDLIMHDESSSVVFNIKQIFTEDYLVLGEPVFKKYTLYLDYGKERVGFAIKRQHFQKQFINVVSLIRFLVFTFCCGNYIDNKGCACILCSTPCRIICGWCFRRVKSGGNKLIPGDKLRLKQYSPIQENPYDDISDKIKTITTSGDTTQVDGHPDDSI